MDFRNKKVVFGFFFFIALLFVEPLFSIYHPLPFVKFNKLVILRNLPIFLLPLYSGFLGLLYSKRFKFAIDSNSKIDGANIGARIGFWSWIIFAIMSSFPSSSSEFSWSGQLARSLQVSVAVSVIGIPVFSFIGIFFGLVYVYLAYLFGDREI